jgi:hypothetical protein
VRKRGMKIWVEHAGANLSFQLGMCNFCWIKSRIHLYLYIVNRGGKGEKKETMGKGKRRSKTMGKGKRRNKTVAAVVDQSLPQHQKVPSKTVEISGDVSDCPIYQQLMKLGFYLKREKVDDCLRQLGDSINGLDDLKKAEMCFEKFLFSNLNSCGSGILPSYSYNHNDLMLPTTSRTTTLDGPFILQVSISSVN